MTRFTVWVMVVASTLTLLACSAAKAADRSLPSDTGVINVRDYGAVGDGKADDTAALRAAVHFALDRQSRYATPPMVYLPKGTYRITGPIAGKVSDHGWSGGWRAGLILWGESRQETIIKLQDQLPEFGDRAKPLAVLATGSESDKTTKPGDEPLSGGGNRAFRHSVINLTIDIGVGNPGAVGIDYVANNRGTIEAVTIRSSDPSGAGHTGLKMTRNWPGPCLIKDVLIEGFDRGIDVAHHEYGNTFEDITLLRQNEAGLVNRQNMLAIHRLRSTNAVPVIKAEDNNGLIVLVDGHFVGTDTRVAAVTGKGEFYLRDVRIEGYTKAIDIQRQGAQSVATENGAAKIDLYTTERFGMGEVEEAQPLRLPIQDTPAFWSADMSDWVKPQQHLPQAGQGTEAPVDGDWTEALQAAMDAGKPVVYLPNGSYRVSKTILVPPHVRLIIGFQSSITLGKDQADVVDPLLRFVGQGGEATIVEHVWISGHVEHAATRAVAFRHCDLNGRYRNTAQGTGALFIEDTIGPKPLLVQHPQNVFARQLNIEFGHEPLIENHGGNLWLLGYKTEGEMVCIRQTAGQTELLGGLLYPLRQVQGGTPAFLIVGGKASLSFAMSGPKYPTAVRIRVKDGEQNLTASAVGGRATALVTLTAGNDVVAKAGQVDPDVIQDGGVPFRKGKQSGDTPAEFTDKNGNTWSGVALGSTPDLDKPDAWKPLQWNPAAQRWEGEALADQAPSFHRDRILRGRAGQGKLVGLIFKPAKPGVFALSGKAVIDTWLPDSPSTVVVQIINAEGKVQRLVDQEYADRSVIDWSSHEALKAIRLQQGDRLLITFSPLKGQTGSLSLSSQDKPTAIDPLPSP